MTKKRWMQFGIRGMLIAMAVFAIAIVSVLQLKSNAESRAAAFRNIETHGGVFGYKLGSTSAYRNGLQFLGVDEKAFWETKYFMFGPNCDGYDYQNPIDDAQLAELSKSLEYFPILEELSFKGCDHISDNGIASLPFLPNLQLIDVTRTSVSDLGIAALKKRFPNATIKH